MGSAKYWSMFSSVDPRSVVVLPLLISSFSLSWMEDKLSAGPLLDPRLRHEDPSTSSPEEGLDWGEAKEDSALALFFSFFSDSTVESPFFLIGCAAWRFRGRNLKSNNSCSDSRFSTTLYDGSRPQIFATTSLSDSVASGLTYVTMKGNMSNDMENERGREIVDMVYAYSLV